MADELLRARVAFVESNLEKIGNLMDVLRKRKDRLEATQGLLETSATGLYGIVSKLNDEAMKFRQVGDFETPKKFTEFAKQLNDIADNMSMHRQNLDRSRSVLALMSQPTAVFPGVEIETSEVKGITDSLAAIRRTLAVNGTAAGTADDHRQAWETYRTNVHTQSQDLFAEYVDLLGGLAVRDAGLDRNACTFVEQLFRFYALGQVPLTIPSRSRVRSRGWCRVMRLGFPEWTIWTLPLIGQDFWIAVGRTRFEAEMKLAGITDEDTAIHDCLADAFGTLTLGPAYAYAAIGLRFDPFTAHEARVDARGRRSATEDDRAHAVLTMLRQSGNPTDFAQIAEVLEQQWREALQQATPQPGPDPAFRERITTIIENLAPRMRSIVDTQIGLTEEAWRAFQDWPDKLLRGQEKDIPVAGVELRWVLNAAWIARVKGGEDNLKTLTERSETLWNRVVEVSADSQRGPRPPQR